MANNRFKKIGSVVGERIDKAADKINDSIKNFDKEQFIENVSEIKKNVAKTGKGIFQKTSNKNIKDINKNTNDGNRYIKTVKCPSCGGDISFDINSELTKCSYCGLVLNVSDLLDEGDIRTTRVKENVYKEAEPTEIEGEEKSKDDEEGEEYRKSSSGKATLSMSIIFILSIFAFYRTSFWCSLIAVIQSFLLVSSWLMGARIISERKKNQRHLFRIAGLLLIIPFLFVFSITTSERYIRRIKWNDTPLAEHLPKPSTNKYYDYRDYNGLLSIKAYDFSQSEFNDYSIAIQNLGFTIDAEKSSTLYAAFNPSGYEIILVYDVDDSEMDISYYYPKETSIINWPDNEMLSFVPKPESNYGIKGIESEKSFSVTVANMDKNAFDNYIDECIEFGFTDDYSRYEKSFSGKNKDGIEIHVSYEGFDMIHIKVEDKRSEENSNSEEEHEIQTDNELEKKIEEIEEEVAKSEKSALRSDYDETMLLINNVLEDPDFADYIEDWQSRMEAILIKIEEKEQEDMQAEIEKVGSLLSKATSSPTQANYDNAKKAIDAIKNDPKFESYIADWEDALESIKKIVDEEAKIISSVVYPDSNSKLGKDYDSKYGSTTYYFNVDGKSNKPSLKKWGSAVITDGVYEYFKTLESLGMDVTVTNTESSSPYSGFNMYESYFKASNSKISWTMYLMIQDEDYIEYEFDINS